MQHSNLIEKYIIEKKLYQINIKKAIKELKKVFSIKDVNLFLKENLLIINRIKFIKNLNLFQGIYKNQNKKFGFIKNEYNINETFVAQKNRLNALNNDEVYFTIVIFKGKLEAKIIKVLKRFNKNLHLKLFKNDKSVKIEGLVSIDGIKINIINFKEMMQKTKNNVLVQIGNLSYKNNEITGKYIKNITSLNDEDFFYKTILLNNGIDLEFNQETLKEANEISKTANKKITKEIKKRKDLRNLYTVTIDGDDSKDLDDAISLEKNNKGYKLYVHIADVSFYVKENSQIDKTAYQRGNSIYVANSVIPMLPKNLSDNLCSLNPNTDKLTISVEMDFDSNANFLDINIYESVINTNYRLTYSEVNDFLENKLSSFDVNRYKIIKDALVLKNLFFKQRKENLSLDFNIDEIKIKYDENSNPIKVEKKVRKEAERIIEEFMIKTNNLVALKLNKEEIPIIYRTHEKPKKERLLEFYNFFNSIFNQKNIKNIKNIKNDKEKINKIIDLIKNDKNEKVITSMILKSMSKAKYEEKDLEHYGLSLEKYSHFTSPIRRYSDLYLHRLIKKYYLEKNKIQNLNKILKKIKKVGEICNEQEQISLKTEREIVSLMFAKLMKDEINNIFIGKITSILNFGIFVELENGIEGLIHFKSMGINFSYDDKKYILKNNDNNKIYKLGDEIKVILKNVNIEEKRIDFDFLKDENSIN